MRVIAGTARSLPLKAPEGLGTRPTTDRIKETLFNILAPYIPGSRFLDLFSGSGAIGIEALSRGAQSAVFVDNSREAVGIIRQNLSFTRLDSQAQVLGTDASSAVRYLQGGGVFDLVFLDPPYGMDLERPVLEALSDSDIVDENTILILEENLKSDPDCFDEYGFEVFRVKKYKTNKHIFFRRKSE